MITRKRKIKPTADEISLQVSFGIPDMQRIIKNYYGKISSVVGDSVAKSMPMRETDITTYLRNSMQENDFFSFENSIMESVLSWFISVAIRKEMIVPSKIDDGLYFFSPNLHKKPGRPKKENTDVQE